MIGSERWLGDRYGRLGGVAAALVVQSVLVFLSREGTNGRSLEAIAGWGLTVSAAPGGVLASR